MIQLTICLPAVHARAGELHGGEVPALQAVSGQLRVPCARWRLILTAGYPLQMEVHEEPASKVSEKGFRRFLVDTPLDVRVQLTRGSPLVPSRCLFHQIEPTASSSYSYGSHHGLWRLDGRLIAFAVLDLLPGAVSSVYFVWDPEYSGMSLGKLSALREAQMVREMEQAGLWAEGSGRYMMGECELAARRRGNTLTSCLTGFYIHTCPKMRYKADYQPSFLLEPVRLPLERPTSRS